MITFAPGVYDKAFGVLADALAEGVVTVVVHVVHRHTEGTGTLRTQRASKSDKINNNCFKICKICI